MIIEGFILIYPNKLLAKPLTPIEQQELIDGFAKRLKSYDGILMLFLIGSASRLQMTNASDFDFIAVFGSTLKMEEAKKAFYCSPRPIDWPCDVLWYEKTEFERRSSEGGICSATVQDGVKLL